MAHALPEHRLVAFNTATASENQIHDDAVATRLGFGGGLVPGVDVYGYLCHPVLGHWGRDWLAGGWGQVRFDEPVYDGDEVVVRAEAGDDGTVEAGAWTAAGRRAGLRAGLGARTVDVPALERAPRPDTRPPASPAWFAGQPALGTLFVRCDDSAHLRYLHEIRDLDSPTTSWGVCHPGWLLRRANDVLVASVTLGPWIHVASTVWHLCPVGRHTDVEVRGRVRGDFERKGHRFVDLDVVVADPAGPAVVIDHRAIYRPRQLAAG
jgi:acyl dehydratase